jgi:hypothetical protein
MVHIKKFLTHMIANQLVLFLVIIITLIVLAGAICFHFVEGWGFFDSFYFTSVTMSTIGYGDMAPLTHGGKIISIIYGFMGAPLFIGLTGVLFQSRLQKLVKGSIHAYHKEIKEAEKVAEEIKEENKLEKEEIKEMKKTIEPTKKSRWKKIIKRK